MAQVATPKKIIVPLAVQWPDGKPIHAQSIVWNMRSANGGAAYMIFSGNSPAAALIFTAPTTVEVDVLVDGVRLEATVTVY